MDRTLDISVLWLQGLFTYTFSLILLCTIAMDCQCSDFLLLLRDQGTDDRSKTLYQNSMRSKKQVEHRMSVNARKNGLLLLCFFLFVFHFCFALLLCSGTAELFRYCSGRPGTRALMTVHDFIESGVQNNEYNGWARADKG